MKSMTTVQMPVDLHRDAKIYCAQHGLTLTDLVSKAVGDYLKSRTVAAA